MDDPNIVRGGIVGAVTDEGNGVLQQVYIKLLVSRRTPARVLLFLLLIARVIAKRMWMAVLFCNLCVIGETCLIRLAAV